MITMPEDEDFFGSGPLATFTASQAPFHTVEGLLVVRDKLSYRVRRVLQDTAGRNIPVSNEPRLEENLFARILNLYNRRIENYGLVYEKISIGNKESFALRRVKLLTSDDQDSEEVSGYCEVFPTSFVCMKCGDFQVPNSLDGFDPRHCKEKGCTGRYEQVSVVRYCENCGRVERMYYHCKNDRKHAIVLSRVQKDLLRTWKFRCRSCDNEQMDILGLKCNHKDPGTMEPTSNMPEIKFAPLTLKEGGVFTPVVVTTIDIPSTTPPIDIDDVEYVLLGTYLGEFDFVAEKPREVLSTLRERLRYFTDVKAMEVITKTNPQYAKLSASQRRLKLAKDLEIDRVREVLRDLRRRFSAVEIASLNDLLALKGLFSDDVPALTYTEFVASQTDDTRKAVLETQHGELRKRFGLREVTYIADIKLTSSCIGIINGLNKFYQKNFVPHFEPLWDAPRNQGKFHGLVYPFRTEGILIELDQSRLISSINQDDKIPDIEDPKVAASILMGLRQDSEVYKQTETVLHSMSHAMIRKSALWTGLDSDSLGELLFPTAAAFFIFSHSAINTGGLGFVFENSLPAWFEDTRSGLGSCTFDPVCIHERGACFACLYLPEHVCVKFNQSLDRDVFVGRHRFHSRIW